MSKDQKINRRQFVIGSEPFNKNNEQWETININDNLYLSHCKTLPVEKVLDQKNNAIYLIGLAVQTDQSREDPIEELKKNSNDLTNIYESWAGRWVLLTSEELHMDMGGLLGCFYLDYGDSLWISSSVNILKEVLEINNYDTTSLPGGAMKWYPLPTSSTPPINSLLPSQILLLKNGTIRARELFPSKLLNLSEEEALDIIQSSLIEGIRRVSKTGKNLWIALSAGYDSRMLLAAALKAKVPVKTYTMKKKNKWYFFRKTPSTSVVSKADMTLPPLIAKEAGVEHKWIYEKDFSESRLQLFDDHTNKQTVENDRLYFAKGQWEWTTNNDAVLLGQVTEVGNGFYYNNFNYNKNNIDKESILKAFILKPDTLHANGISDYVEWVSEYNKTFGESSIDWRDKFYLEQRVAGWLSSLQQGMDLIQGEKVHLINCQRTLCAMLALPKEKSGEKTYINKLINRMSPELAKFPLNPADPFIYDINKKISSLSRHSNPIKYAFSRLTKLKDK